MHRLNSRSRSTLFAMAVLACPLLQAQEFTPNTGMYFGINVGESRTQIDNADITQGLLGAGLTVNTLSEDRRDTGYKAYLGVPLSPNWALEAGYFDLGRFGFTASTTPAGSLSGSARVKGLNLDVVGFLPVTDRWSLLGRLGAAYAQTKDSFSGTGAVSVIDPSPSKYETNYKYGLGMQYAFSPGLSMRLEAERYRINDAVGSRSDVDMISLGLVFHFGGANPSVKTSQAPYTPRVAEPTKPVAPAPVIAQAPVSTPAPVTAQTEPPAPAPKPWVKVKLVADSLFGFDQDNLQSEGKKALDKLLSELKTVNIEMIQITGHTDRLGLKPYNDKLSTRRAEAVQNYLVQIGGIPASKVTATGVGSSQPDTKPGACKGSHPTPALIACLSPDRRVDVQVSGTQQER